MAAPSPIIDLSSDEEDTSKMKSIPVAAAQATTKKEGKGTDTQSGGGGDIVMSDPVSPGVAPVGAVKGKTRKARGGKNSGASGEESSSPRLSNWGEPLPPEPETHTPVEVSPRERGSKTPESSHGQNGNGSGDIEKKIRGFAGVKVKSPSSPPLPSPPADDSDVCRLFWRAGDYEAQPSRVRTTQGAMDHVRVHPKFLHSNATSHKWALGAVAELLDNAVDEVMNGATFVSIDKMVNPRDNSPALLVQDDGGGMTPDCMRQCMSLGYSRKNTNTTIGQYGNGFKTSTMRLGADVIVFSRCRTGSVVTQSIGLLSYTFLRKTGHEDVVVPMIDYEIACRDETSSPSLDNLKKTVRTTLADWHSNLSSILQWSPYSSEPEILAQFNDLGWHGTKVIVYNLWFNDDGVLELDFDSDEHDIQLRGGAKQDKGKPVQAQLAQQHIANRYHHSLRVYASILYLQTPPGFQIILRGQPVEHHSIANDLKFPEQIIYKPQIGNNKDPTHKETSVITIIGFTKEAPLINVHGFNVYHKNRLIMPFWKVWQDNSSRGRGVVGVLEANFVEPAHDKQDFERTAVLLRLETRLKQMTVEYWNLHCHLIGYQPNTKAGKQARKQAAAPPPVIEYPAPIASINPPLPHGSTPESSSANLSPPTGSRPTSSVPTSSRSPVPTERSKSDGPQVKAEPVDLTPDALKRPGYTNASEALHRLKRQRTENVNNSPASNAEDGQRVVADTTFSTQADESVMIQLVEENSQLLARIADYEHHTKKLEQHAKDLESKVTKMEREFAEERERALKLQQELEQMKIQERSSNQHMDASKDNGNRSVVDAGKSAGGGVEPREKSAAFVPKVIVKVERQ